MNILIANSESETSNQLIQLLHQYDKTINILGKASSAEEATTLFSQKDTQIDLAFLESRISNDLILQKMSNSIAGIPIVFTSAFKKDAYDAIKANSIDFLLEPFNLQEISQSITKAKNQVDSINIKNQGYKKRFLIKFGDKIQFKAIDDISYIFAEGKIAYIVTRSTNRKYIIEHTLDELEKRYLDPSTFYRINRKFIVHIDAIEEARSYVNSRLKLIFNPATEFDMVVSREKVHDFKNWLNL